MAMQKGASFEFMIRDALQRELDEMKLGIDPASAKIYRHKPYWSRDREKKLVVDVSLELCRQGVVEPYFIWVWECENYGRPVPVDDVEEFHSKLEQIGLHRVKGTLACRDGFQESAISYAKAKGIGLAYWRRGNIIRLMESERRITLEAVVFGLTHPSARSLESLFFGITTANQGVFNISDLIQAEVSKAAP